MDRNRIIRLFVPFFLLVVSLSCSILPDAADTTPDLQSTLAILATQNAYQATQIMANADMISYLATRGPAQVSPAGWEDPTPYQLMHAVVIIEDGDCCAGGKAGEMLPLQMQFEVSSAQGEVVQMRVSGGTGVLTEEELATQSWQPYEDTLILEVVLPINWSGFYVTAQFMDDQGNVSIPVWDDISLEGSP